MTQEQFLKAETIMKKIRVYREVISGQNIEISYHLGVKPLVLEPCTDEYEVFEKFIMSQIMKFEDELKNV